MESFVPLLVVSGVAQGQTPKQEPLFLQDRCHTGALAEKAEHIQQDDDEDRYAREPQDEIAKHGLHVLQVIQVRGRSW